MPNQPSRIFEEHLSKAGRSDLIITVTGLSNPNVRRRVCDSTCFSLLNLSANFSLSRDLWPELTKQIEGFLGGQQSLLDMDGDIEQLSQSCTSRIGVLYREVEHLGECDYREVNLDSLEESKHAALVPNRSPGGIASLGL